MKLFKFLFLLAFTQVLATTSAFAQNLLGPVQLTGSEQHIVESRYVDQSARLKVSLPSSYSGPDTSYPVVYLLGGDSMFDVVSSGLRLLQYSREIPELILVGISYESDDPFGFLTLRSREFTPTTDPF